MPRSRVCMSCGTDTAGTPPTLDPHHGWMLVTCPRCARITATRRSNGVSQWGRRAYRALRAGVILSFNAFFGSFLLFLTIIAGGETLDRLREFGADPFTYFPDRLSDYPSRVLDAAIEAYRRDRAVPMVVLAAISLVAGAWLRASLRHIPPLQAGAGYIVVVYILDALTALVPAIRADVLGIGSSKPVAPKLIGLCVVHSMTIPLLILGFGFGVVGAMVLDELRSGFFASRVRAARRRRLA